MGVIAGVLVDCNPGLQAPLHFGAMSDRVDRFEKAANSVSRWFGYIAEAGMVAMLAVIIADVIGIKIFSNPVPGGIEIVAFLGVVVTAFAIAFTHVNGGHIRIEFLTERLKPRSKAALSAFVWFLSLVLFVLLAWRSYDFALVLQRTKEVSMTQRIPFFPFVYAIALCCVPVCMVLLAQFLKSVKRAVSI